MVRRLLNYVRQIRRTPQRIAILEQRIAAFEQAMSERTRDLVLVSAHAREHTEAAVAAAQAVTLAAAREHTEAAVSAAQSGLHAAIQAASADVADRARKHAVAASEAVRANSQLHAEQLSEQSRSELGSATSAIRREMLSLQRVVEQSSRTERVAPVRPSTDAAAIDPGFYVALEDRFRGTTADIEARQRDYISIVAPSVDEDHPLFDLGCGRGEWLRLLRDAGLRAVGIDDNPVFIAENLDDGLSVIEDDLMKFLGDAPDESAGAITAFQVLEHLDTATLVRLLEECARVLCLGGVLIAETPNALNLQVAASNFWIDPTHVRPLHPEFLEFCALRSGFTKVDGLYVNELDPSYSAIEDPAVRRLAERFDGPGDFALLAWK